MKKPEQEATGSSIVLPSASDLLSARNGISGASRTARRVLLLCMAATALLLGALSAERVDYQRASAQAIADVKSAAALAERILLEDERLTMSAQLASATGESQWVQRYEAHLPAIDKAIAQATALAPSSAAERFDRATRAANDRLVELEKQALAHVAAGRLPQAQAILHGADYAEHKRVLAAGTDAFMAELQAAVDAHLGALERRSWALVLALVAVLALGFAALWQRLQRDLRAAETSFADKQEQVARLALHDTLTGLANRRFLHLQLEGLIARSQRQQGRFAVMLVDLDGFKPINDRHGHAAGDAVLMAIGERLAQQVRKGEIAARLGGDEFVVVLALGADGSDVGRAAQRLIRELSLPVGLPQGPAQVGASVGVALFPDDGVQAEDLLRKADVALYRAKNDSRGDVRFFKQSMDEEVRERDTLDTELRAAIAAGEIVPYFQPLVELSSGRLTGFEVLARWPHPSRGLVPPASFVPVAEATGQIDALTVCVMRAALQVARHWDESLTIAVNIAPQQLRSEALVQRLLDVLRETGFPPQRFEIEITENALIGDIELARRIVLALKSHGIRVALDDFGTGYSSLSHLSDLPFDKIKIDRSFIHTMQQRPESASIVNAIVGLGRSLQLPTTAEGIESEDEARLLRQLGCQVGQGYLFSKPVAAAEAEALIGLHHTGFRAAAD